MKIQSISALSVGLMLVLSSGVMSYHPVASAAKVTMITVDEVPRKVRPGDSVTFTGMLTTADGEPISQGEVKIYLLTSDPRLIVAASGVTGLEGTYEVTWDVELIPTYRANSDVTRSVDTQVMSLFAQFDGNEQFGSSKTGKSTVTIEVNSINVFVNAGKNEYREGESATIFIGFVDADDSFEDPDSINANFNLTPISDDLERKKVGSYTYVTPPLQRGHNQVSVVPLKAGYNIQVEVVTITVITEGSVGPFAFP